MKCGKRYCRYEELLECCDGAPMTTHGWYMEVNDNVDMMRNERGFTLINEYGRYNNFI
jgi:hypothetical protein